MLTRLRRAIPEGLALPDDVWTRRHRVITLLVFAQAAGLTLFGVARGYGLGHSLLETAVVALAGLVATRRRLGRRLNASAATFGLVTTSALLVHFSRGTIEAHFHFFVMLAVISLYQAG